MARMAFTIILAPQAAEDLNGLRAAMRSTVKKAIGVHQRHEPRKISRSRIKRLRGLSRPQYRLMVDDVRVFYDVTDITVEILAVVAKAEAESWLSQFGKPG